MSGKFPTNQRLFNSLIRPLSEKVVDPEVRQAKDFAKQHYQDFDDQEAFDKFVVRSLRHAKDDDTRQNHQLSSLRKELDDLKAQLSSLEPKDVSEGSLTEKVSYSSDRTYSDAGPYKRYNLYITKKKYNNLYFIAVAENPRSLEAKFKVKGNTPQDALNNLRTEIDKEIDVATKVSGQATLDFNVDFVRDILEMSTDPFYAKIIPGPKLVLAGPEMLEYPDIMRDEGFKVSSIRTYKGGEGTTKLPGVPLSPRAAIAANLIANGRYVLSTENTDKDGNKIFDLEFDSVVQSPTEKMRMRAPAFTVGTVREKGLAEAPDSVQGNYEYQPPGASRAQTSQVLNKMKPSSKFVWKKPNQIGGSFSEQDLLAKGFKKSQYNSWGGTAAMWQKLVTRECAGSGVIASKKQAKDPRYSTSLTKDVRPGQIAKNLKAFSLEESVTELFEPGKDWNWSYKGRAEAGAEFQVGEVPYEFSAFRTDSKYPTWDITFKDAHPGSNDLKSKFGLTGTGNSAEVMSTVTDIMRAFLQEYQGKVKVLTFSAKESSRRALYARMAKRLLPTWDLTQDGRDFKLSAPASEQGVAEDVETAMASAIAKLIESQLK